VFCCTGDGGLWYHLAELETLARLGIPVKTVVLDNSALAFEAHILDTHFGGQGQGLAHYRQVDFAAVARELGVAAERVESETELRSAFRRAIESPGPFLLDVVVDGSAHPPLEGGMPLT
jgi:acetolactate synthase-1/2/3 large subunit